MYTQHDYNSKKELKADVKRRNEILTAANGNADNVPAENRVEFNRLTYRLSVYQPGPFGFGNLPDQAVFLEGPHYPRPHKWYAHGEIKGEILISVK